MDIIAHRGAFLPEGPIPELQDKYTIPENTLEAYERAFKNAWALETDVRKWHDGSYLLIHDPDTSRVSKYFGFKIPTLDELCQLATRYIKNRQIPFVAFQIKRNTESNSGVEVGRKVANKILQYGLKDSILFDATIEEAKLLHQEFPWLNLSVSVGEDNYSPTIYTPEQALTIEFTSVYNCIWADEWKIAGSIYNEELFRRFRAEYPGRIDIVSPELHYNEKHPYSKDLEKLKELWSSIIRWNMASGICTDYPTALNSILEDKR